MSRSPESRRSPTRLGCAGRSEPDRRQRRLPDRLQHPILDRDPLYTAAFRRLRRDSGVTPVVLPAWSPNLNAFAERFVESAKSECLDGMVLLGERHLRTAIEEFARHYHEERPHHGLGNEIIAPQTPNIGTGPMKCRERLGGLLKFYYREAA